MEPVTATIDVPWDWSGDEPEINVTINNDTWTVNNERQVRGLLVQQGVTHVVDKGLTMDSEPRTVRDWRRLSNGFNRLL